MLNFSWSVTNAMMHGYGRSGPISAKVSVLITLVVISCGDLRRIAAEEFRSTTTFTILSAEPLRHEKFQGKSNDLESPSDAASFEKDPKEDKTERAALRRQELVKEHGGNEHSERAVAGGLRWIVSRQASDGGWNFNHNHKQIDAGHCPNPGSAEKARNGATGMALLPLLAAGHTHQDGKYQKKVQAGLDYLTKNMKLQRGVGSWHEPEGNMYAHGFAALAVCDAYARTHDKELRSVAQAAVNYIVAAQDPAGGGWRYAPKMKGDTSVTTLQVLALKRGDSGELRIPKGSLTGSGNFFDSVQADDGAEYGYTNPAAGRASTTAMGLLARIHLGWEKENDALERGVAFLERTGPRNDNIYYTYYATQVMFHYGGAPWERWNDRIRDVLVRSQEKGMGPPAGSWFASNASGDALGGRLYYTALATLILETYYREPRMFADE